MSRGGAATAFSAGLWSAVDLGGRSIIQFVISIILARLLSPSDFGIFALMLIFTSVSLVLIDGGFSSAIIQKAEVSQEETTAVFWYNTAASLAIGSAIVLLAPVVADGLGYPVLREILMAIALSVPVLAIGAVPSAMLQRSLRFDRVAIAGITATVVSGGVAVLAALNGAGVWTFVSQALTAASVNTVVVWALAGWRPSARPRFGAAREMAGFGSLIALSGLLEVAYTHGSSLIIGRLHGTRELGFYNRGQSLQSLPANVLAAVVARVALPVFSAKSQDHAALRRGVRTVQGVVMLVNLPLMAALAIMPDLVIQVVYGAKWLKAAPVLSILAIGGMLFPLHAVNLQVILAQGRSETYFRVELAKKVVGISFVATGSYFGIVGMAIGQTVFACVAFFINAGVGGRMIGYGPVEQLRDLTGPILLTAGMVALLLAVRPLLSLGDQADLGVLTLLGGGLFVGVALLLDVGRTHELIAMTPLRALLPRRPL